VVTFAETARVRGYNGVDPLYHWMPANVTNVARLISEIDAMQPSGRSNWMEGFDVTFNLIENSLKTIAENDKDDCNVENVGLLFFSDGDMNLPAWITSDEVTKYVETRIKSAEAISETGDYQIHPFLYSISNEEPKQTAKDISCVSHGIWIPLTEEMSARNATLGYETLFSTPLSDDGHINFTTWSNPYTFTSSGEIGRCIFLQNSVASP
jgi:hypothetical protein